MRLILQCLVAVLLAPCLLAQQVSLGDVARSQRAKQQSNTTRAKQVWTDDDMHSSRDSAPPMPIPPAGDGKPHTGPDPVIDSISTAKAMPGEIVTIKGSHFGAGSTGKVWLGTAYGEVKSWSDTEITASVASDAKFYKDTAAMVLQGGASSNIVAFSVSTPYVRSVSPDRGKPGDTVRVSGTNFGKEATGQIWLGTDQAQIVTWSDTEITARISAGSKSGVVRVSQQGSDSPPVTFTVVGTGTVGANVHVIPDLMNIQIGETRPLQALDNDHRPMKGLVWISSDPRVVSLSNDDPPTLTAVSPGHATITAGDSSADVTVWKGPLPLGTVKWRIPDF